MQQTEVLRAALGRAVRVLMAGSGVGMVLGYSGSRVLSNIGYQTARDLDGRRGGVAMALLGLVAARIPAQRALLLYALLLLREE